MIWGGVLVTLGIVLIPTPLIPGTPVILTGLGLLSSDLRCARVMLQKLNGRQRIASARWPEPERKGRAKRLELQANGLSPRRKTTGQFRRTKLRVLPA